MKLVRQLTIIFTISFLAEVLEYLIPIPVAASIYGLVLMLAGLLTGIIPLAKVEHAADFLVEILPVLFVPPTVSIMTAADAMKELLIPLCVISVVSTVVIMGVTGRVAQALIRLSKKVPGPMDGEDTSGAMEGKGASEPMEGESVSEATMAEEGVKR